MAVILRRKVGRQTAIVTVATPNTNTVILGLRGAWGQ